MNEKILDFVPIMEELHEVAEADGKVSDEEVQFLASLKKSVDKYEKALREAYADDFISEDEFHDLVILRDNILNRSMEFSTDSDDINKMIAVLFDEINKHEIPGMMDDEPTDSEVEVHDEETYEAD